MSRPPFNPVFIERTVPLKMQCPGCGITFYWMKEHPYCSAECREVETAARALKQDDDKWAAPPWVAEFVSKMIETTGEVGDD